MYHYIQLIGGPLDGFYFIGHGYPGSIYAPDGYIYVCNGKDAIFKGYK